MDIPYTTQIVDAIAQLESTNELSVLLESINLFLDYHCPSFPTTNVFNFFSMQHTFRYGLIGYNFASYYEALV